MSNIPKSQLDAVDTRVEVMLRKLFAGRNVNFEDLNGIDILSPDDDDTLFYNFSLDLWENHPLKTINGESLKGPGNIVISGGSGTPAGTTGQVQYNNAGAFAADTGFTYDDSTNVLFTANGFSFVNSGVGDSIFKPTTKAIGARNGSEITTLYQPNGSYSSVHLLARDSSLAESSEIILELRSDSDNNITRIRLDDQEPAPIFSTTLGGAGGTEYYLLHENNVKTVNGEDIYGSGNITIAAGPAPVIPEAGTNRNISNTDAGAYIRFTNTGAKTATFGTGITTTAAEFNLRNAAASGDLTITPSSTTINGPTVIAPGETATVKLVATATFDVIAGDSITADNVSYDNTTSGLAATDVQAAIDELSGASVLPFSLQDYIDSLAFNGGGRLFGTQDWIYTNNGYTLQGFGTTTGASYSGALRTAGKLYFEVLLNSRVATMQIGVSQRLAAVSVRVGLNTATGSNLASWSLDASGFKYHGSGTNISLPSVTDDVIQVAVDFATGKIWFGVNNTFSGDPVAGTGEAYSSITGAIRPGISPDGGTATLRLKLADFDFSPPTGFSPWSAP